MVGFPGTYQVEAWAYVDGSLTTFGKVDIEIVPGVEKVIDIGGPALKVSNPASGAVFEENSIEVSGIATDESGVESITVNGIEVEFFATNSLEDANEVRFSVTIELEEGENIISTVAYDSTGNESTDSRIVYLETPEILEPQPVEVAGLLDIKPGSCKNPFNMNAKGLLPVVLLGSENIDVSAIDIATVNLEGVAPVKAVIDDGAALLEETVCETDFADGYMDLVMKFERQEIVSVLGDVADGDVVVLNFTANSYAGEEVTAKDNITIIDKKGSAVSIDKFSSKGKLKKK